MIGNIISHYKIIEKVGSGGMGEVYKAQDLKLDRFVALKFLPPELMRDKESKQRFIHEAKTASSLQHNNICTIHDIDETKDSPDVDDGQLFISMELYEGESLKEKIEKNSLTSEEAIDITIQISEGLKKAHEKGIIHRDIKPANIFITTDGVAKILDFGLAKISLQTKLTKFGSTVGTIAYMSPEQARGDTINERTDIWSLGVVLYEMLNGAPPFKGEYDQAVIYSILNEEPVMMEKDQKFTEKTKYIVKKALQKSSDDRYQKIDAFLSDIKELTIKHNSIYEIKALNLLNNKKLRKITILISIIIIILIGYLIIKPILFDKPHTPESINIAVISAENQTGDASYDYLRKVIPNLIITNLEQHKFLQVLTWERMSDLLKQLDKEHVEYIDKNLGFEICKLENIDAVIIPSFMKAGNMFVTDVKVLDVNNKNLLKSANSNPSEIENIFEQIDFLSEEISKGVGLSVSEIESVQLRIAKVTTNSIEAYKYFLEGRDQKERHEYAAAHRNLYKAIELDSTFAMAYFNIAITSQLLGDRKAASNAWEEAFKFSANTSGKERLFIESQYYMFHDDKEAEVLKLLKRLVTEYPKEKRAHYQLGKFYNLRMQLYSEAISEYNKVLELDPNWGRVYNSLGYIYSKIGEYRKAIESFEKYASLEPDIADPMDSIGEHYVRSGKIGDAIVKFNAAMKIDPEFGSDRKLSYAHALNENFSQALEILEHFILITPTPGVKAEGYMWKCIYLFLQGKLRNAE
ncbi:protein kinase, partial [Bacteroidota bacterium]